MKFRENHARVSPPDMKDVSSLDNDVTDVLSVLIRLVEADPFDAELVLTDGDKKLRVEQMMTRVAGFKSLAAKYCISYIDNSVSDVIDKMHFLVFDMQSSSRKNSRPIIVPLCRSIGNGFKLEHSLHISRLGTTRIFDKALNKKHAEFANEWINRVTKRFRKDIKQFLMSKRER